MSTCNKNEVEIDSHVAESLEGLLADCIKKYPIIYDRNHRYHLSTGNHQEAWDQISDELNLEMNSCKILWNGIKQKFIKYRKKIDKNECIFKEWPIFDNLRLWLDPHIKKRRTKTDMYKKVKVMPESAAQPTIIRTPTANKFTFFKDIEAIEWNGMSDENDEESIKNEEYNLRSNKNVEIKKRKRSNDVSTEKSPHKIPKLVNSKLKNSPSSIKKDCTEIFTELDESDFNVTNEEQQEQQQHQQQQPNVEDHPLVLPKESKLQIHTELKTYSNPIKNQQKPTETIEITNGEPSPTQSPPTNVIVSQQDILPIDTTKKNSNSPNVKDNIHLNVELNKLEEVVGKCVGILERCIDQNTTPNSGEVFGKYIASLVQEIPAVRRIKCRMLILEFVTDLVAKELND